MVDIGLQIIGGLAAKLCPTLVTPWTIARQAPLSMGFSKQESWSGLPFPSPGYLPYSGIKFWSPALQVDSLGSPYINYCTFFSHSCVLRNFTSAVCS